MKIFVIIMCILYLIGIIRCSRLMHDDDGLRMDFVDVFFLIFILPWLAVLSILLRGVAELLFSIKIIILVQISRYRTRFDK